MSFLTPWFLLGLLGVAIPLAIHLSRRQKAEKVVFSTIRFLKKTPQKTIRFQQIRQWLLLLIRAAIIALLTIAFARPFLVQTVSDRAGSSPRSVVILLDTSMSMRYGDAFERAKKAALEVLGSLHAGDEAALVTFSDSTGQVTELTTDLAQLAGSVPNLDSPGFNSTAYLPALRLADRMLHSARHPDRTVYLVSDYQRRAVDDFDTRWRLSPGVAFEGIKIGDKETANLAVTEVKSPARIMRDQEEHLIIGRVRNLGTRLLPETRLTLKIDEKIIDTQKVDLGQGTEAVVTFRTKFRKRGIHRGAVTVEDAFFAPDNTFYFTVDVLRPLAVLGVVDAAAVKAQADETRWFASALGNRDRSLFDLDLVRPAEITGDVLQRYHVVVFLNAGELASTRAEALAAYLEKGGSLLIAPAARVAARTFNRFFDGMTPAALDQKQIAANGDFLSIAGINQRHPIIKSLGLSQSGDFGAARFHGHWSTKPVPGSDVILRFDNGEAALLEKKIGRGRVLLLTSSLDPQWNNLPRQGLYVPLLHEMLRYLAFHEEKQPAYTVGEPLRLRLPAGNAVRVTGPNDAETILTSTTGYDVVYRAADRPGFYGVRGHQESDVLAVNVALAESALATVAPEQIGAGLINQAPQAPLTQRAGMAAIAVQAEKSQRWWWWILLVVLFLGLGETLLANRTYR
ncbi:hypothetical protein D1BOALGB6SA_10936 [Olavius sp. associated proteobacterium Delta 1]|nr:hypothetical protein D1BOALGB6SA_10936 [Olavius sp. associated proteobacterium Delta 1]